MMERLFLRIYDWFKGHRAVMWAVLAATVCLSVIASLSIDLKEDVTDFLPADKENQDVCWAFSHIGSANKIVITVSATDSTADRYMLMDAVDSLESRILGNVPSEYIKSVTARVDADSITDVMDFIVDNLPYYLDERDYDRLDSLMAVGTLDNELAAAREVVASPMGGLMRSVVTKDPLMLSSERLRSLEGFNTGGTFSTTDDYIFTKDGDAVLTMDLAFSSSDTYAAGKFIKSMDKALEGFEEAFGGKVTADPLGSVFIAYSNSSQIKRDSILSIIIALVLIAFLLVSYFRSGRSILLVGVTIGYGFLLAFGCVSVSLGSMSLIVVGLGAVIIGIAANYPLHFISHIKQGYTARESLSDIVQPLTTGNITTVGAFLSLVFIASPAMRDLGLFAALLLVGTIIFTLVFLPHLVKEEPGKSAGNSRWTLLSRLKLGSNKYVIIGSIFVTLFLGFFSGRVMFDTNLHNINYMTERQAANMDKMLALAQGNSYLTYVAVPGADLDEAIDNYLGYAGRIDSLSVTVPGVDVRALHDFVPSSGLQELRLSRWNKFVSERGDEFIAMLKASAARAGFTDDAFAPFERLLEEEFVVTDVEDFFALTDVVAPQMIIQDSERCAVVATVGADWNCTDQVAGALGDGCIVFDSSSLTGRMVSSLSSEFDYVLYVCAFIVFVVLLLSFGRLELAGVAFLPLTVGWIWILGLMGLLGIDFNIVNVILATFIFGMGDDYTIFITEGCMYEHAYGRKMLQTYESTILLSALIMFVGIGALIVAKHPAMQSLAYVIMIGMFCVVLMADIIPPFVYRWLTMKKGRKRIYPITIVNFLATALAFVVLIVGATVVSLAGFFLITCTFGSKKGKALYHRFLSAVSGFIFRNVFFTKHTVDCRDSFDRQAIMVANHQSHLDLMALLMLTPKMIVVTNKWAWNNPFYGILIRYADFCPVDNVLTDDLSRIEAMIDDGYSVLVFPEGTRTLDGSIGRFHRGAFYLAEKYGLDILPVVLHGINDVLPKQDLLLRKGHMTVKVLDRIRPEDASFGEDYRERARTVRRLMVSELEGIAAERETVDYFADRVIHNYIYKGAEVERSVRRSLRMNANYASLASELPDGGCVLFVNPGYGEPALICALAKKNLRIHCRFDDEMKGLLAENCAGVPANLIFTEPEEAVSLTVRFSGGGYNIER